MSTFLFRKYGPASALRISEPSLDALSLRSAVISSIIFSLFVVHICPTFGVKPRNESRMSTFLFRKYGPAFGLRISGFRVPGIGFQVSGSRFRVSGSRFRVSGFGFGYQDSGFGLRGFGVRDSSFGIRVRAALVNAVGMPLALVATKNLAQISKIMALT